VIDGARADILVTGAFDAPRYDATLAAIRTWGARPDAALWFSRCRAEGVKPR
jgi:hypothetical protein